MAEPYPPFNRPEAVATLWVEAWMRRDADALAALFDDDADFVNVVGLWWHDRAALRKAHAYGLAVIFPDSTLTLQRVTTKWLRDDVAVVHARMRLTGQTPAPGAARPGARTTILSFVVHRRNGRWSCASAQNTDVVPGMETHVAAESGSLHAMNYRRRPT
jgi:uncharacterized protein (TIGR02246 family)